MMERGKKYLSDILTFIELIESFVSEIKSFDAYTEDYKTKSAVERQLAIIGEAINKYSKEPNAKELNNARSIISLRNRLVHAYDSIDDSIIWSILARHIDPLKREVFNLLQ